MSREDKLPCPKCKAARNYTTKMFNTKVCDKCNTIISSAKSYKG